MVSGHFCPFPTVIEVDSRVIHTPNEMETSYRTPTVFEVNYDVPHSFSLITIIHSLQPKGIDQHGTLKTNEADYTMMTNLSRRSHRHVL